MFEYRRPTLQFPSQDVQSHLIRRPSSHVMPMVLVKKAAAKSSSPYLTNSGISSPYAVTSGSVVNSIPSMINPYLDAATSKGSGPLHAPPMSTGGDLTSAGSNFVLDSNAGTFTVLSPNNNNYIPSVHQETTKKPFVRLPPVSNGFAPVSYSSYSIGSPAMSSPFLVSHNNADPYSATDTISRQYVVSSVGDGNQVAATNNPYLDAVAYKGTTSHSALPKSHFTSAGSNVYLNPSGNNVGIVGSSYPASSGSGFNSISATNNPYLDAVTSKDSNPYTLLPRSTTSGIASATSNFLPDSNKGTFSNSIKRMAFPTAATTPRNPFLSSSKATFRPTTRPTTTRTTTTTVPTAPPAPAINPFLSMSTTKTPLKIRKDTFTSQVAFRNVITSS